MPGGLDQDISKIIATLAELLEIQGDHDIALFLRGAEFELEQTEYDDWNGGTYTYSLLFRVSTRHYAELGDGVPALEERLLAKFQQMTRVYANEHLGSIIVVPSIDVADTGPIVALKEPGFWTPGEFKLFISHVSAEKALASAVAKALRPYGITGFVAHEDIEPTKPWEDEIVLALNTMDAFLAVLTPGFETSIWCGQEVGVAVGRGVLVVPARRGLDPYGFIGRYQGFQALGKVPSVIAGEVASILATHQLTRLRMAHALVSAFEQSGSWDAAKIRTGNLGLVTIMPSALRDRVRIAARDNDQIESAWGVPQRIESILAKFE